MNVIVGGFLAAILAWLTILPLVKIDFTKIMDRRVFRIFGGIAIITIALIIAGVKLPKFLPLTIACIGLITSIVTQRIKILNK